MVRITFSKEYMGKCSASVIPDALKEFFNRIGVKSVTVYGVYNDGDCVWCCHNRTFHRYDNTQAIEYESREEMVNDMMSVL